MRLSRGAWALATALWLNILLAVLLTPLGFESRPPTDLTTIGYIAIGAVFAGLLLDLASFIVLLRRSRLASILAVIGSVLFIVPIVADRTGSFFSLPVPPVVNALEYVFMAVLLATFVLAWWVHKESDRSRG